MKNNAHNTGSTKCPHCNAMNSAVVDSRPTEEGFTRRRRACKSCDYRWYTIELPEEQRHKFSATGALLSATQSLNRAVADFNALRRILKEASK